MKELTVAIQDEYEWKVIYRTELYTEEEYKQLEEENKKLNIKVASLEWEIKWLNYTIDKLKEENQTLELWLDNKEKLNEEYRKEIKEHQLYEEKLEHRIIEFEELLHWE